MNQQALIQEVSEASGMTKKDVEHVLKTLGEVVSANVGDDEITLPGIGKLKPKTRAARTGRNPANGDPVQIAALNTVTFKPAKSLIDALN
jgi:DNA-binding protein HU-beta